MADSDRHPEPTPPEAEPRPADQAPPQAANDPLQQLQAEAEAAQAKANEYLDQWRRTAAEFSNYRKRKEKEQAETSREANAQLMARILAVLDDF
ncbi:MAG: nucleotide exchange factor GrpE, partial [Chloroflexi bacterium]|nr:nucleotide exchange factor GrpE [Chloroflexota bacterium]